MTVRLGEVMVEQGLLTRDQVRCILKEQQALKRPFGELAERLFGVSERDVEMAWARQYAGIAEHIDPRDQPIEAELLALIDRRQAWQFRMLPLRRDGEEIMVATMVEHLPRALRFAIRHFNEPCYLVICSPEALGEALMHNYPLNGMTAKSVFGGAGVGSDQTD
ncbi:MAG: hypothetical protein EA376_03015 [Phycisphaeraceae bacterium]|nr:MAG: hypothetical protein EA376_03015 [Phycisphaeraceae bacterium]